MQRFLGFTLALFFVFSPGSAKAAKDQLVIGITQFPSTFHPNIDSMMAKTYILSMTRRPVTAYDTGWNLVCMLCVELPTIENGLAIPEKTPDGESGIAVTFTLLPDTTWGDGTPVTTADVLFTWEAGKHPKSGVGNMELYRSLYKIDIIDAKTFTMHFDKLTFTYNAINDFGILPAHLEKAKFEQGPQDYHRLRHNPHPTRALQRALCHLGGGARLPCGTFPKPPLAWQKTIF